MISWIAQLILLVVCVSGTPNNNHSNNVTLEQLKDMTESPCGLAWRVLPVDIFPTSGVRVMRLNTTDASQVEMWRMSNCGVSCVLTSSIYDSSQRMFYIFYVSNGLNRLTQYSLGTNEQGLTWSLPKERDLYEAYPLQVDHVANRIWSVIATETRVVFLDLSNPTSGWVPFGVFPMANCSTTVMRTYNAIFDFTSPLTARMLHFTCSAWNYPPGSPTFTHLAVDLATKETDQNPINFVGMPSPVSWDGLVGVSSTFQTSKKSLYSSEKLSDGKRRLVLFDSSSSTMSYGVVVDDAESFMTNNHLFAFGDTIQSLGPSTKSNWVVLDVETSAIQTGPLPLPAGWEPCSSLYAQYLLLPNSC
jgi:hypothetical protein